MAVDRDALRRDIDRGKQDRAAGGGVNFIGKGTIRLRILEFVDAGGVTRFHRKVVKWGSVGPNNKRKDACVNRQGTWDLPDAFEKACQTDPHFPYTNRAQYFVNAIDLDAKVHAVERWALPYSVWEAVAAYVDNEQWADVLEPATGHAFVIVGTGDGLDREYSVTADRQPWAVPVALLSQVVDPWSAVEDIGVEGQCRILNVDVADLFPDGGAELEPIDTGHGRSEPAQPPARGAATPQRDARPGPPARGGPPAASPPPGASRAAPQPSRPTPAPAGPPDATAADKPRVSSLVSGLVGRRPK